MNKLPLISVIIPVYNPGENFRKCLYSVINQTYKNLEIILVDDGSTDGSGEICEEFASFDKRICCFHQKNRGVSNARNTGLKNANGDYYHFPDSDDYLELDTYEYLLNLIYEKKCDVVAFEHFITYADREITHFLDDESYGYFDDENSQVKLFTGSQFCCNKLFSKKLIENLYFREDIFRGEDTLFAAQAFLKADCIWFDKRPLYHYVQSKESACRGALRKSQFTVLKLYEAYQKLYNNTYQNAYYTFLLYMQEVLISLYFDAWSDDKSDEYIKEKKEIYNCICKYSQSINENITMSKKQFIKISLFKISPSIFCMIHKIIHKL